MLLIHGNHLPFPSFGGARDILLFCSCRQKVECPHFLGLAGYAVLTCLAVVVGGCAGPSDEEGIEDILLRQSTAWNAGDIDSFMEPYWHSDDLTFSASGRTTRGWDATLKRYKQRYPDRRAMGTLRFCELDITLLSRDVALVLGEWHLTREEGDIGGEFSLVFQRIDGQWVIRHDHTSRLDPT